MRKPEREADINQKSWEEETEEKGRNLNQKEKKRPKDWKKRSRERKE